MNKVKYIVPLALVILTNGIYFAEMNNLTMYLRFFEDGRVISANVPGKYSQINRWFNTTYRENIGFYTMENGTISFTTNANEGSVEYSGRIGRTSIRLDIHSNINGHKLRNIRFRFARF